MSFNQRARAACVSRRARPCVERMEPRVLLAAQVTIDLNGTAATTDDITLFNKGPGAGAFTQKITALITDVSLDKVTLDITANPATDVSFDKTQITLMKGQNATITITPLADSSKALGTIIQALNDAGMALLASQPLTIVSVAVPQHVRNSDTPTGMNDRIPNRVNTPLNISVAPDLKDSGLNVTLIVTGQDAATTGTVTFAGNATQTIASTGMINLTGDKQTTGKSTDFSAPNAGKLKLVAQVRGESTTSSDGFSVAAIISGVTVTFKAAVDTASRFGFSVLTTFTSDSGNASDIEGIDVSEEVKYQKGTGAFADVTGENSGYLTIKAGRDMIDSHTTPKSLMTKVGMIQAFQTFKFRDRRTGANDIPVPNSGFIVTREIKKNGAKFDLITTKEAAKTTANGIASDAGTTIDGGMNKIITRTQTN